MKKLLTLAIVVFTLLSCNKSTFNVNVELKNAEGKMIYLQKFVNNEMITIDSVIMDSIVNFVVEAGNPSTHYSLKIENERVSIKFFSENMDVKIVGDIKDFGGITKTASYAQQLVNEYNAENANFNEQFAELSGRYKIAAQNNDDDEIKKIREEIKQTRNNQDNYRDLFLTKNTNSFVAPYILYNNRFNYELNEIEDFVNKCNLYELSICHLGDAVDDLLAEI